MATFTCGCGQDGALELESAELRFETSAKGRPSEVAGKAEVPMMAVVAEMMIFANAAVARRIYHAFPRSALLRRHPAPRPEAFKEVQLHFCSQKCSRASEPQRTSSLPTKTSNCSSIPFMMYVCCHGHPSRRVPNCLRALPIMEWLVASYYCLVRELYWV